jgi:hypothetical protein
MTWIVFLKSILLSSTVPCSSIRHAGNKIDRKIHFEEMREICSYVCCPSAVSIRFLLLFRMQNISRLRLRSYVALGIKSVVTKHNPEFFRPLGVAAILFSSRK